MREEEAFPKNNKVIDILQIMAVKWYIGCFKITLTKWLKIHLPRSAEVYSRAQIGINYEMLSILK